MGVAIKIAVLVFVNKTHHGPVIAPFSVQLLQHF